MINAKRLARWIQELGQFGAVRGEGITRTTFTDEEVKAREWLVQQMKNQSLAVQIDPAANIWGRRPGRTEDAPAIVFGSHIDTVPGGGKYDGALGVLVGLEVMATLEEQGIQTDHPLELVSFSGEEANPFGLSTFGSRSVSGKLTQQDIDGVVDSSGNVLTEVLERAGGSYELFNNTKRSSKELAHFLELHIEQGRRLLDQDVPLGIVTGIAGIYREVFHVQGEANHAGTTLMKDRKDALVAASTLVLELEKVCKAQSNEEVVATVGVFNVTPNAANIVPGDVRLVVEVRGQHAIERQNIISKLHVAAKKVENDRGVRIDQKIMLDQAEVYMDEQMIDVIEHVATQSETNSAQVTSMAGHDAAHMATLTPSGCLFVPSLKGISHSPLEESRIDDIAKAANVFLKTVLALDHERHR
ncbi:LOW QUALITY PROTEIN: N-carbamoyl-L-amino acid hydrolase [Geomicrobium sp. JCM 19037]|nr:LOW QUALITY PROTEIN: N-carbamoyl-L-amino acid hydrolase [Geomicrobium sp. JCM 19037]